MSMLSRLVGSAGVLRSASRPCSRVMMRSEPIARMMSSYPADRKYVKTHEWLKADGDHVTVGITEHAAKALGDVVFVDTPNVGDNFAADETMGVVESVKAASDIYCPLAGTITEVNDDLSATPELVNSDPHGDAWFIKMKLKNPNDLDGCMSAADYEVFVEENK